MPEWLCPHGVTIEGTPREVHNMGTIDDDEHDAQAERARANWRRRREAAEADE